MEFRHSMTRAAAIVILFGSATTLAAEEPRALPFRHLATSDAALVSAISACYSHSLTCQRLIDEIESSSVLVYLRRGQCQFGRGGSCLLFSGATPGFRYLQIVLDKDLEDQCLISAAAHELQHVVEVVRAPQVVDVASLRSLYQRIGFFIRGSGMREEWETFEAQRIALVVGKEVRRSQRAVLVLESGRAGQDRTVPDIPASQTKDAKRRRAGNDRDVKRSTVRPADGKQ
jgi:hypothetical protein